METPNKRTEAKLNRFKQIIALLEIRKKHFAMLSNLQILPMFLRAKYKIKSFELESEIIAKQDFVKVYSERIVNTKYAENVITPDS